ncbi:MAG: hypothetical protein U0175_26495 [Caldilineaceae bacterium]
MPRLSFAQMWQFRQLRFLSLAGVGLLLAVALLGSATSTNAQAGANCSADFFIDKTLSNGARWQLCWEQRNLDGIVYHDITFTPPGGTSRKVLAEGSISQVHVPYDDNSARFHDITDDGFGDENLNDLTPAECPNGTLLKVGAKDALCQQILPRGYAFKGVGTQQQGELLSLFSVSTSGEYNYIPVWRFLDNGTLELQMGAAGKLQRFTTDSRFGWPVRANNTLGTAHIHNYYWRLDFDLGENAADDVVEELNYVASADNSKRTLGINRLTSETGRSIDPTRLRSWRIRDGSLTNPQGDAISYQLEPNDVGQRDVGPTYEPWTNNDFYVTKANDCERYVSHNPTLNGCASNLAAFVNGESVEGADVVLWYGVTFHHIPRDEDEPLMHTHWNGFRLVPRDWMDSNPSTGSVTTCAVGDVTCDGKEDAADALFMLQYDVQLRTISNQLPLPAKTLYGYSCDVSGEGDCNVVDALFTLQCSVGLENLFCPGSQGVRSAQQTASPASVVALHIQDGESNGTLHQEIFVDSAIALGALSLELKVEPSNQGTFSCEADPSQTFDLATCHIDEATGMVRLSLLSASGVTGKHPLGRLHFTPSATNASTHPALRIQRADIADRAGNTLPSELQTSSDKLYLPMLIR